MAERRRNSKTSEGRSVKASGVIRHGAFSGSGPVAAGKGILETIHHAELLETKIAAQAAEIKQLAGDNQRLASTQVVMREELVTSQHEIQRLKMHMRNLQTESDVQLRVLIDRIKRMEADIRAGEGVRNDLQQARKEAQGLVTARRELNLRIQEATQELKKVQSEIKSLPDLHAELDSLRKEHKKLRKTFEHEKGLNINEVQELRAMEDNLISMAREMEKLRIQVSNAEKRAQAPKNPSSTTPNPSSAATNSYAGGYMNHEFPYQPPMEGSVPYYDPHARSNNQMGVWPPGERMIPQESNRVMAAAGAAFPDARVATVPSTGVDAASNAGVAAVPTGRGSVVPTSADAAGPTSRGAITPNSADADVPAADRGASGSASP